MSKTIESVQPPLLKRPVKVLSKEPLVGEDVGLYYKHTFHCLNCYEPNYRWILKGTLASEVVSVVLCSNCECQITT